MLIRKVSDQSNTLIVKCPGCGGFHQIWIGDGSGPRWQFNGDFDHPTFSPSLLVRAHDDEDGEDYICHSFIRDGHWEFLSDCTHSLAGQRVPMISAE